MKKLTACILIVLIALSLFSGCGGEKTNTGNESAVPSGTADADSASKDGSLRIVCTIFPQYDWVKNILGANADHAELTLLLDNGVDLHSYSPTVQDMAKISVADVFIYVGGESDAWVEDALIVAVNPDMIVVNLLEVLGDSVKAEEVVEGMEAEEEEGEEEVEYDEHVWLSLKNAAELCRYFCDRISAIDPDNAETYAANTEAYLEELNALDAAYQEAVDKASVKTVLFGDRFPFRYLTDDYGLDYYAAFVGCSAETEASFETIVFLANKLDELGLPAILQIESADGSIAQTIRENTQTKDQEILTLDSLQSVTSADAENGASYLQTMQNNLDVLRQALN